MYKKQEEEKKIRTAAENAATNSPAVQNAAQNATRKAVSAATPDAGSVNLKPVTQRIPGASGSGMVAQNPQNGYQGKHQQALDDTMQKILDREEFSYDLNGDALWGQYKDQYTQQGKMAMMDAMGQAAAMTGGYGSSYGQMAGQQAYQGYLQQLNQMVPELYQLALQKYQMEGDVLMDQYGLLADQDDRDYNRHLDERNFTYQQGRDQVADEQWRQQFEYQQGRDQISDQRYDREWQYQQDRDALEDSRYDQEWEYQQNRDQISDNRYDQEWEYQLGRDQVADQRWQTEFDEDKRRYDQEFEASKSRGSGGGSKSEDANTTDYTSATSGRLRLELRSCENAEEAEEYAYYMIRNGADATAVWAAYQSIWGNKEEKPAKGTNKKPAGKNSYASLS